MSSPDSEQPLPFAEEDRQWLLDEADRRDIPPAELLASIVAAHRLVASSDEEQLPSEAAADLATESDLDALQEEFMELVEDVRSRVIQVKRETDTKAPAEHDHPDLIERIDAAAAETDELESHLTAIEATVDELEADLSAVEADLSDGFDNYETILTYLLDRTDTLTDRVDTLARALLATREQLRETIGRRKEQQALEELKQEANEQDVAVAECDACGGRVRISLLTTPECPHCSSTFTGVEASSGLSGLVRSDRLVVGDHPALMGRQRPEIDDEIEADLEAEIDDSQVDRSILEDSES